MATITVDLIARTAAFQTEMQKANRSLQDLKKSASMAGVAGALFSVEKITQAIDDGRKIGAAFKDAMKGEVQEAEDYLRDVNILGFGKFFGLFRDIREWVEDGTWQEGKRTAETAKELEKVNKALEKRLTLQTQLTTQMEREIAKARVNLEVDTDNPFAQQRLGNRNKYGEEVDRINKFMEQTREVLGTSIEGTHQYELAMERLRLAGEQYHRTLDEINRSEKMLAAQRKQQAEADLQRSAEAFADRLDREYKASPAYQVEQFLQDLQNQLDFSGKSANEVAKIKIERDIGLTDSEKRRAESLMLSLDIMEARKKGDQANDTGSVQQLSRNQFYGLNGGESVGLQRQTVAELKQVNRSLRQRPVSAGLSG